MFHVVVLAFFICLIAESTLHLIGFRGKTIVCLNLLGTALTAWCDPCRGGKLWGETVNYVTELMPEEGVRLDAGRLGDLYHELGEAGAEDVLCRAMQELTQRLTEAEQHYSAARFLDLRKTVRSLVGISDQVGMKMLARVAGDVVGCIDQGDPVALAATLARLMRIGEQSLSAAWELQGLSI